MIEVGTRVRQNGLRVTPPQGSVNGGTTRDVGLLPDVTASCTFSATAGDVTAADGTFAGFAVNEVVFVKGSNLNDGFFTVTGTDLTNEAFLVLEPAPKAEGPITVTIRTA